MLTRRQFLKYALIAGASMALPIRWLARPPLAEAFSQSQGLKKFNQALRGVGGSGIPVAQPDAVRQPWWQPGVTHYTIDMQEFTDQLHPSLPNPTHLWGYGQGSNFKHLGGAIVAQKGHPVQITFRNNLPIDPIIPPDKSPYFMDAAMLNNNRVSPHLHGGFTPWISDGAPNAWFGTDGMRGSSFQMGILNPNLAANEGEIYYTNDQTARLMWYHDHAHDITRTNAYSGLATAYVLTDDYEAMLTQPPFNLPGPVDPRTIYLVFQDKIFIQDPNVDPSWPLPDSVPGDLWYPHNYDLDRWGPLGYIDPINGADPSLNSFVSDIPEFFGDTMLVNGLVFPSLAVEQRQYRFRMLNADNARFLNPRLVYAGNSNPDEPGSYSSPTPGPAFIQIGTEGGFLPQPVMVNGTGQTQLLLAPAERADLIVDFRDVKPGTTFILYADAPAPYPMGDPINDYYPGSPNPTPTKPGYGPNTRTLMQFKVKPRTGKADPAISLPTSFTSGINPFLVKQVPGVPTDIPHGVPVRYLTLNEVTDLDGRLIQMLGTNQTVAPDNLGPNGSSLVPDPTLSDAIFGTNHMPLYGRLYMENATEVVHHGATEVWEIINQTGDTHPMHLHLVNFQVLSRTPLAMDPVNGTAIFDKKGHPTYAGAPVAPEPNELGWKETVRVQVGTATRIIARFDLPKVPFTVPYSTNPNLGTAGYEYVWHCHILEHEEHDMMRPMVVI